MVSTKTTLACAALKNVLGLSVFSKKLKHEINSPSKLQWKRTTAAPALAPPTSTTSSVLMSRHLGTVTEELVIKPGAAGKEKC